MQETIYLDSISVLLAGTVGTIAVMASSIAAVTVSRHSNVRPTKARKRGHSFLNERVSMTVDAQNKMNEQLILRFKIADPDIILFRIELATQLDKAAGIIDCVNVDPQVFVAAAEPKVVQRWYNANRYWNGETKQLPIRVFLCAGGQAVCRTIWVMMSPGSPQGSGPADVDDFTWILDGPC